VELRPRGDRSAGQAARDFAGPVAGRELRLSPGRQRRSGTARAQSSRGQTVSGTPRRGHVPRLAVYFNRLSSPFEDRGRSVKSHRPGRQHQRGQPPRSRTSWLQPAGMRRELSDPGYPVPGGNESIPVRAGHDGDATRLRPEATQVWQGHSPRKPLGFEAISSSSEPHGLRYQYVLTVRRRLL
jgi:hypothetical protein